MEKSTQLLIGKLLLLGIAVVGGIEVYKRYIKKPSTPGPEEKSNLFGIGNCIGRHGRITPCLGREKYIHPANFNFNGVDGNSTNYQGVVAGEMFDWNLNHQLPNHNRVNAGDIKGANTRPESYSYMGGQNAYNRLVKTFYKQPTWVVGG